ncbi:hypothetical protein MTQ13_03165 [Streptomyces sp. XM4011]|uniref:hypothetical protein n=1 Tax=Streptomyces sp. XM4011 TaxID=2929780 RepID=UPI001FFB072A|nr:hypothetical protein [Streptomyces sp. XM4011]MCK1813281.1 hypothetical protein [Streptomyces sp. XM4011]
MKLLSLRGWKAVELEAQPAVEVVPEAEPAAWPEGVVIRFVTVGGAHVDVTGPEYSDQTSWYCHGCKDKSQYPYAGYLSSTRSKANDHASACRALPKPEVSR